MTRIKIPPLLSERPHRLVRQVGVVVVAVLVVLGSTVALAAPAAASEHTPRASGLPNGTYLVAVDFAGPLGALTLPVSFSGGSVSVGGTVSQFRLVSLLLASGGDVDSIEITTVAGQRPPVSSSAGLPDGTYVVNAVVDDEAYELRADVVDGKIDLLTPVELFDALLSLSRGGQLQRFGVIRTGAGR
jgi:hypothetical protein